MLPVILFFISAILFAVTATLNAIQGHFLLMVFNIFTLICFFIAGVFGIISLKYKN